MKFLLIGLKDESKKFFYELISEKKVNNIIFESFLPIEDFVQTLTIADVFISYYDSFDELSMYERIPGKSTFYLCYGTPTIFADLPSMREWVDDEMVYFVEPDKPELLAEKIKYIFDHPEEAKQKGRRCIKFAKENSYENSYKLITSFIQRTD